MFRILESIELQGWRELPIDMPLSSQRYCPCDGTTLRTAAAIVGEPNHGCHWEIPVGCCPSCGYIGYQERPTAEWFAKFYAEDWDRNKNVQGFIDHIRTVGYSQVPHPLINNLSAIPFDADAKVFEVGTGYGWGLVSLAALGYKNTSGVESCPHRARVAREGFWLNVCHESVEDHAGGPYDVIVSYHVLEHCYDPGAIVAKLASLQAIGGHLMLGVPNCAGEPTMGVLTFLPHLHSFTTEALARLLQSHGYAIVSHDFNHTAQVVVAKYTGQKWTFGPESGDCFAAGVEKLRRGTDSTGDYLMWPMHQDEPQSSSVPIWTTANELTHNPKPRCLRVEPIRERMTDAPVEVQWAGSLRMFVK